VKFARPVTLGVVSRIADTIAYAGTTKEPKESHLRSHWLPTKMPTD